MTDPRITQSPGTIARVWQRRAALHALSDSPDRRTADAARTAWVGHEPCDDPWDRWDEEVER